MTEFVVDLRYIAENQPSLCIPRVFNNIDEHRIRTVFDQLRLGEIERIDVVARKNDKGEPFKRVYVHFKFWYGNTVAQEARRKLISGKEIKVVYDNPWFWKVSANKWDAAPAAKRDTGSAPYIDFETDRKIAIAPTLPQKVDEYGRSIAYRKKYEDKKPQRPKPNAPTLSAKAKTFEPAKVVEPTTPVGPPPSPVAAPCSPVAAPCSPVAAPCSPVVIRREPRDEDSEPAIDYGNVGSTPPQKKLKLQKKKPQVVEEKPVVDELYGDL